MVSLLSACATGDKESILPQDGPSMKEVYQRHFSQESGDANQSVRTPSIKPYRPAELPIEQQEKYQNQNPISTPFTQSTRQAQQQFPRLKNPTLILYVFPHLSHEGHIPVPGYATGFSFYETIEFALPGEPEAGY
jgi:conjugative transfer region lipoprotein (TIGR03751 family)